MLDMSLILINVIGLNDILVKRLRDYSDLIDMIVSSLANRGFVKNADNPDEIMITQEGIDMCYRLARTGWHASDYPMN